MDKATLRKMIPDSVLPMPEDLAGKIKYSFWKLIYPIFGDLRNAALKIKIVQHEGRQRYLLGMLKHGRTIEQFLKYLETQKFGNHFVAWEDDGELIGLRRLDGFKGQHHLRIFQDGEVRGHYEFTPEAHPWWHWTEHGEEERATEFKKFLGDWVTTAGK